MRSCYTLRLDEARIAIADLCDYYGTGMILTRINVPEKYRGQGHANALLKQVLDDADREGVRLYLEIQSSDGLSYDELERWYLRNGFARWRGIYRRLPQK